MAFSAPELKTMLLTSNRFWGEDFHFSIFTIRHPNPLDSRTQFCRNFWKIIYILSGSGQEVIDGTVYELRPNMLFVIHPDEITRFELPPGLEIEVCNIIFPLELIGFGAEMLRVQPEFMKIFTPEKPSVTREQRERLYIMEADQPTASLIRSMLREFNQAKFNYQSVVRLQLLELLCRIARQGERNIRRSHGRAMAEQAAEYLREHYRDSLDMEQLAARFGVSRQYLHRIFSRTYGISIGGALRRQRLMAAYRMLLEHPGLSTSEICYRCGFNDLSYFYRCFRAEFGCVPGRMKQ